jgi:hypothetical protein
LQLGAIEQFWNEDFVGPEFKSFFPGKLSLARFMENALRKEGLGTIYEFLTKGDKWTSVQLVAKLTERMDNYKYPGIPPDPLFTKNVNQLIRKRVLGNFKSIMVQW